MKRRLRIAGLVLLTTMTLGPPASASEADPGWLGMVIRWSKDSAGQRLLVVVTTAPGGPAASAGLLGGDIIQTINGQKPNFGDDLDFLLFLAARVPGERLKLGVIREGRRRTMTVTVAALPASNRDAWNRGLANARRKRLLATPPS